MTYIAIGLIVGMIVGLTGAGGALVSIPLFIHFLDLNLKEATVLSLIAVLLGTSINLFGQFLKIDFKITFPLTVAGILANGATLFMKPYTPDLVVAGLLIAIALYSLWSVWSIKKETVRKTHPHSPMIGKSLLSGVILGVLTTLTGLGGGVILVPILIKVFGKNYQEALPTSLGTIFLISLTSFLLQAKTTWELITFWEITYLAGGVLIAFFLLKILLSRMEKIETIRKFTFSLVTLYSAISVMIEAM